MSLVLFSSALFWCEAKPHVSIRVLTASIRERETITTSTDRVFRLLFMGLHRVSEKLQYAL
jgi:hypothetical protein